MPPVQKLAPQAMHPRYSVAFRFSNVCMFADGRFQMILWVKILIAAFKSQSFKRFPSSKRLHAQQFKSSARFSEAQRCTPPCFFSMQSAACVQNLSSALLVFASEVFAQRSAASERALSPEHQNTHWRDDALDYCLLHLSLHFGNMNIYYGWKIDLGPSDFMRSLRIVELTIAHIFCC